MQNKVQRNKNTLKGFMNRRNGVMKKGNTLNRLTGARIAMIIEYGGLSYSYKSDNGFAPMIDDIGIPLQNQFGPDHFDTVADREMTTAQITLGQTSVSAPSSSTSTTFGSSSDEFHIPATSVEPVTLSSTSQHRQGYFTRQRLRQGQAMDDFFGDD